MGGWTGWGDQAAATLLLAAWTRSASCDLPGLSDGATQEQGSPDSVDEEFLLFFSTPQRWLGENKVEKEGMMIRIEGTVIE